MKFKQLESFVAVVQNGSFTKAAEALYTTQPTISNHIKQLEIDYDCQLFARTTKSLHLTERGQQLYDTAVKIMRLHRNILSNWSGVENKNIRIGASSTPASYLLPQVIEDFKKAHPDTRFYLDQGDSQQVVAGVLDNQYDLGFVGINTSESELLCEPFYQDKIVLIAPDIERFRMYKQHEINWHHLLSEPMVMRKSGSGTQLNANRIIHQLGIQDYELNVVARAGDHETVNRLVASGLGVSLVSELSAKANLKDAKILTFELPMDHKLYPTSRRDFYVIQRTNKELSEITQEFKNRILSFF